MDKIQKVLQKKKFKHAFFIALVAIMTCWVIFRFAAFSAENRRYVFNASRMAMDVGMPVETMTVQVAQGTLYEPLDVKNNRAYVSGERAGKLRAGQKISF